MGMVEWNGIFRLFRFSGILGQPREVHPKFRNEIPEMSVPFAPKPGISGIFGRMESAHSFNQILSLILGLGRKKKINKQTIQSSRLEIFYISERFIDRKSFTDILRPKHKVYKIYSKI